LGRYLSLPLILEIEEIWKKAEEMIGTSLSDFALVHESHYLPESGMMEKPVQIFEIRMRGVAGTPPKNPITLSKTFEPVQNLRVDPIPSS
jgi:hypothetical protein